MKRRLFDDRANFGLDYSHLQESGRHIQEIEVIPLRIEDEDYEHNPPNPNAFGVYVRYNLFAVEDLKLNPSEWLADFDTEESANAFKSLVYSLLVANLTGQQRDALPYKLEAGWAKVKSQVSAKSLTDDQLRADVEGKWKDTFCMGYTQRFLNDGRAEQWQLFLSPLNDYLMLGEDGDVQEYTYYVKADLDNDLEVLESLFHTFTEI